MDILNLQAFIAVTETGSFSRAAEQLFLTQPAVSKRIHSLENELDSKLFDRVGKRIQLTEAGRALLPGSQRILAELEESRRRIANLGDKVSGPLRIGTSHHIGLHRLPPVLKAFTAYYPQVELDIHFMDSEDAHEGVIKGELELAIATLPSRDIPSLGSRLIWYDPLDVVVSRDHPLTRQARVSVDDLKHYPAILPSSSTFTRRLIEEDMGIAHADLQVAMETNYLETIKMLVSVGLGWSVLPVSMLSPDICHLFLDNVEMERQLGVSWHRQRTLSNAASSFLQILTSKTTLPYTNT